MFDTLVPIALFVSLAFIVVAVTKTVSEPRRGFSRTTRPAAG